MSCAAPKPIHWEDLRNRNPEQILKQDGVTSTSDHAYEVRFLNAKYLVDAGAERITELSPYPSRRLSEEFQILLIRYLVADNGGPVTGVEVSEKDLPGGVTFFQGPHTLYVWPIAERYGRDPEAFEARALELGAQRVPHGDTAMRFFPFPEIPVTYVLWKEDDEFPASVSVLFDKSIIRWFALDMVFTTVLALTDHILTERP
ncbi:DUF3786 domain-containing protein [Desulfomonile tiedjei]|uniref:DUF3786 domain-containing protein n=1 Tax=Desulfomonile tiedjei (strain ATCC 49306 / DSM 6799 / DCB-1) TaxID=706587 RepID=I4CC23_DESTA|nr:DUF3786 domain-containing protein [Desulfomonile tiedjei]AFM27114.1 hypothetical protein Desti_4482 [Desulfomonile tiedjei DSM 6799]